MNRSVSFSAVGHEIEKLARRHLGASTRRRKD
jgi:hypothetical protein